jgi:hypothetical protein
VIDVADLAEVRALFAEASTTHLRAVCRFLWPAAALGEAGPWSVLALELIADELDERDQERAA